MTDSYQLIFGIFALAGITSWIATIKSDTDKVSPMGLISSLFFWIIAVVLAFFLLR